MLKFNSCRIHEDQKTVLDDARTSAPCSAIPFANIFDVKASILHRLECLMKL